MLKHSESIVTFLMLEPFPFLRVGTRKSQTKEKMKRAWIFNNKFPLRKMWLLRRIDNDKKQLDMLP